MVTLGEMKNCEKFRFIADGADRRREHVLTGRRWRL